MTNTVIKKNCLAIHYGRAQGNKNSVSMTVDCLPIFFVCRIYVEWGDKNRNKSIYYQYLASIITK